MKASNFMRMPSALAAVSVVALVALPAQADVLEKTKKVAGVTVHYKVVLPNGYDPAKAYPGIIALGGGPQTMNTVDGILSRNLRAEAETRGYLVVAPAAPDGELFFENGARIFPEFLKMILADYKIQAGKFHIAGPSNGGIAAFHVAAASPQYFISVTAFPGYMWQPTPAKLQAISKMCVFMYVGETDQYMWHEEMKREAVFLRSKGAVARYTVEKGQPHRLETLAGANATRLFDGFEETKKGCALPNPAASQAPSAAQTANSGSLRQLIPGHYVYSTTNAGRVFSSGIIVTDEGTVVVDALDSEAIARTERAAISSTIKQPVRYLVSSSFHDPFSKGNIAYGDVFKIGHENYRAGLLDQMTRGGASAEEQRARLPTETFRDRVTLHVGAKELQILHFGPAHTQGDSIVFVPQDRIAYLSEVFFSDEFPNMAQGYGVSWLRVLDAIEALGADIFVPGHGSIPEDPRGTRASLHRMRQLLIDARDAIQDQIARGATEDQAVAAVKLQQYEKLPTYAAQREVTVRRMYKELTGNLP